MSISRIRVISVSLVLATTSACFEPDSLLRPAGSTRAAVGFSAASRPATYDEVLAAVADSVPGFGGAFAGQNGVTYAYMLGSALPGVDLDKLRRALPSGLAGRPIQTIPGQYDFPTLKRFKETALRLHGLAGVVSTDADEARNRVIIGVTDGAAAHRARIAMTQLGVPNDAVMTVIRGAISISSTLNDHQAITTGSLGITVSDPSPSGRHCTIGYIAEVGTDWWVPPDLRGVRFAITNSHCGGTAPQWMGTATNSPAYQFLAFSQNYIGFEEYDPGFDGSSYLCPPGRRCRFSDAAAYRLANQSTVDHGTLARTLGPPTQQTLNSLTIDPANPTFTVVTAPGGGEYWVPTSGPVCKVGSATGWTCGSIIETCVDIPMFESGVDLGATQLCQNVVQSRSSGGDSGSPAFTLAAGNNVHAVGVVWGAAQIGGLYQFFYSRMDYVLWEFEQAYLPDLHLVHP